MKTIITAVAAAVLGFSGSAMAAEMLPLETPDATELELEIEAAWDSLPTFEDAYVQQLDKLVIVGCAVGDELTLDPGFMPANVEMQDLWIADAEIRGGEVVVRLTQAGTSSLFVADADGYVTEYKLHVDEGTEDPALAEYSIDEAVTEIAGL